MKRLLLALLQQIQFRWWLYHEVPMLLKSDNKDKTPIIEYEKDEK